MIDSSKRMTYLRTLEEELVCLTIRYIMYPKGSRSYYGGKINEKKRKIKEISDCEHTHSVFTDEGWAYDIIRAIISDVDSYPLFIYNHRLLSNIPDPKYLFINSLVEVNYEDMIYTGICTSIDLAQNSVRIKVHEETNKGMTATEKAFPIDCCKRMGYEDSDRYFWDLYLSEEKELEAIHREIYLSLVGSEE